MVWKQKKHLEGTTEDRSLWWRYRTATTQPAADSEIDEGLIAAYLDHRLGKAEQEAVEAWLAATPDAFGVFVAAAETRAAGFPRRVPARVQARARALVTGPTSAGPGQALAAIFDRLFAPLALRDVMEWSATAVVFVAVCAIGFQLGLESASPEVEIDIARGEVPAFDMAAPQDGPYDPYLPDPFDSGRFTNGDVS